MTKLAYAARNFLASQPSVTSLLGDDDLWDTWIFVDTPEVTIENTQKVMVVVFTDGSWSGENDHNTARFPILIFDVWADPTRNADNSVRLKDAKLKIEEVYVAIRKFMHLVDNGAPDGGSIYWGTPEEVTEKTGVRINSSSGNGEPDYSPAFDGNGAFMGRFTYNVEI